MGKIARAKTAKLLRLAKSVWRATTAGELRGGSGGLYACDTMDILREIGNIGMAHAATALAILLNERVDIGIPDVHMLNRAEIFEALGERLNGDGYHTLELGVTEDLTGHIVHVMNKVSAKNIVKAIFGGMLPEGVDLDEMSGSVINEMGNITSAAYVNALAELTGLFIDITPPRSCENLKDGLSRVFNADENKRVLFTRNTFHVRDALIESHLVFVPDSDMSFVTHKTHQWYNERQK
ncbi:CheY-P phosphatase CheC [Clostridia bacterium]|nr:CheY-P phosphatase CheC [Clostridia bacterium]